LSVPSGAQSPRELRAFALSVGGVLLALAVVAYWRGRVVAGALSGGLAFALLVVGVLAPPRLDPVYRAWMTVALAISKVTAPVLMGIVYFVLLTPLGLLLRLVGHRPLSRRRDGATYWVGRPAGTRRSDLRRQF
jgi:Saxitoxin biosynthesis operon protein SxtJ